MLLTGLFGKPKNRLPRGMPAIDFLDAVYRSPGIKANFDGVALHPYAPSTSALEELVEGIHKVIVKHRDRAALYITEMGWGSQDNPNTVGFEHGVHGQVLELRTPTNT